MGRKYRLTETNQSTEIVDVDSGKSIDDHMADLAQANDASGGLYGSKTLVVSKDGNNTVAALAPYLNEFATIEAALAAATAGDTVVVRPGAYMEVEVVLKTLVNIHLMNGVVLSPKAAGSHNLFDDGGVQVVMNITGAGKATSGNSGAIFAQFTGNGTQVSIEMDRVQMSSSLGVFINQAAIVYFKCRKVSIGTMFLADAGGACEVYADIGKVDCGAYLCRTLGGSAHTMRVRCLDIITAQPCVILAGNADVTVEAEQIQITATNAFLLGSGSNGSSVRVRATTITCSERLVAFTAPSSRFICDVLDTINCGTDMLFVGADGGQCEVRVGHTLVASSKLLNISSGYATVLVECGYIIQTAQLCIDMASTNTMRVSIKCPRIFGTDGAQNMVDLQHANTDSFYSIDADDFKGVIRNNMSDATCELHVNLKRHVSNINSGAALYIIGGLKTFYRCDECLPLGAAAAITFGGAGTLHLLAGRIFGGTGFGAIMAYANGVAVVYPGVVLIADAGASAAIDVDALITPTARLMGDIAANKVAAVGVVVEVGSLLVDAAVA